MRTWNRWTVAVMALGFAAPAAANAQALVKADAVVGPRLISMPALQYPDQLKRAGIEGTVVIDVMVDSTGRPDAKTIRVVRSSNTWFVGAATDAVRNSRYEPARVGDKTVAMGVRVPIAFRLRY